MQFIRGLLIFIFNSSLIFGFLTILFLLPSVQAGYPDNQSIPVTVHILALNDFHGQIIPGKIVNNTSVGSAPVVSAYLHDAVARYGSNRTIIALPGDMTGASPPQSGLLLDEPTILFFNGIAGSDWKSTSTGNLSEIPVIATLGNHEFDRSKEELTRLITGGDENTTITHIVDPYPGALWTVVCSNVYLKESNDLFFPPYTIRTIDGIPVAYIGAISTDTPQISLPKNVNPFRFADEAESINKQVELLKKQGIHAFVILLHEGGDQSFYAGPTTGQEKVTGRITEIIPKLDEDVDIVLSGYTHGFTNAYLPNAGGKLVLVTQAYYAGEAYADITMNLDPGTHDITNKTASIHLTCADQEPGSSPDPNSEELLRIVNATVDPMIHEVISSTTGPLSRDLTGDGESSLYNLATDSMRWKMGTDIAVIQIGALRADIPPGEITTGMAYPVMPFNNQIEVIRMSGKEIQDALIQQWTRSVKPDHLLQFSGLSYTCDLSRDPSERVKEITLNGTPLDLNKKYTVATLGFLVTGGDGYSAFIRGEKRETGPSDVDTFIKYLKTLPSPIHPETGGRVVRLQKNLTE